MPQHKAPPLTRTTEFLFEVVERASDRLLDRIEALNAFFGVLMALVFAVVLLAIDRFRLVGPYFDVLFGWIAIALLIAAFGCCLAGWIKGNLSEAETDAPIPGRFIWGVAKQGEEAVVDAIADLERTYRNNLPIRSYKRSKAVLALLLLTLGTVAAGTAKVVYLTHVYRQSDDRNQHCSPRSSGRDRAGGRHPCGRCKATGLLFVYVSDGRTVDQAALTYNGLNTKRRA